MYGTSPMRIGKLSIYNSSILYIEVHVRTKLVESLNNQHLEVELEVEVDINVMARTVHTPSTIVSFSRINTTKCKSPMGQIRS